MASEEFLTELVVLLDDCKGEVERLRIENGLLRKASVEQRELNGRLRIELQQMDDFALGKNRS
jgi:hypothetical protein